MSFIKAHTCPHCSERHFTTLGTVPPDVRMIIARIRYDYCRYYFEESFNVSDMQPDRISENEQVFPAINA